MKTSSLSREGIPMPRQAPGSNAELTGFVELVPAAMVVHDVELDRLVAVNEGAVELFRMPREQLLERNFVALGVPSDGAGMRTADDVRTRIDGALSGTRHVGPWTCRDAFGTEIPCELHLGRMPADRMRLVCAVFVDTRGDPDVHERLRRAREQLRALSGQVDEALASERARLSRELHDQLGQLMTAAKINIAMIARSVDGLPPGHELRPELLERTGIAADVVDQMLDKTRKMAAALRPESLDALGLLGTIDSDLDVFASRTGIQVKSELDPGAASLPRKVSAVLLSCMQELLTNVARHAEARRVDVRLAYRDGRVRLEVRDDGVGMSKSAGRKSLGLVGLKERVAALEGSVEFSPARRGGRRPGTAATIEIPFVRAER
jgi:hypothetical protein